MAVKKIAAKMHKRRKRNFIYNLCYLDFNLSNDRDEAAQKGNQTRRNLTEAIHNKTADPRSRLLAG